MNLTGDQEPERVAGGPRDRESLPDPRRRADDRPNVHGAGGSPRTVHGWSSLATALWNRRYSADTSIVGRQILINGNAFEVVGVMPPGFVLPTDYRSAEPSQLWTPLQMNPSSMDHGSHGYYAAGRLKPGATVSTGRGGTAWHCGGDDQAKVCTRSRCSSTPSSLSLEDEVVGSVRRSIWLLFGAVGFLLLIACANVANLLLARAEARQREMAVRSALGASGFRMLRQLLTESLVLTGVSAIVGLGSAYAAVRLVAWWNPADIPRVGARHSRPSRAGLHCRCRARHERDLQPRARAARPQSRSDRLAEGRRTERLERRRRGSASATRSSSSQMALAVLLLVGAGLMLRSLWSLQRIPIGFDPVERADDARLVADDKLSEARNRSSGSTSGWLSACVSCPVCAPQAQPGCCRSGRRSATSAFIVEGYVPPPGTSAKGDWQIVTDGYLEAMGERVVRGRTITAADTADGQLVALVNEELARLYFAGRDPIGGRLKIGGDPEAGPG